MQEPLELSCNKCNMVKPVAEFVKSSKFKRGYNTRCRKCNYEQSRDCVYKKRGYGFVDQSATAKYQAPKDVNVSSLDLSWIAAFTDAEGSFYFSYDKKWNVSYPRVTISNTDKSSLEFIQSKVGGMIHSLSRKQARDAHRQEYTLQLFSKNLVRDFCQKIEPFLTIKKPQCELLLRAFYASKDEVNRMKDMAVKMNHEIHKIPYVGQKTKKVSFDTQTPDQWSYFAGYIEGDGTIHFVPENNGVNYYPRIAIFSTNPKSLVMLQDMFGGSLYFRKRQDGWKAIGSLVFKDQELLKVLIPKLQPYIKFKNIECEVALNSLDYPSKDRREFANVIRGMHNKDLYGTEEQLEADLKETMDSMTDEELKEAEDNFRRNNPEMTFDPKYEKLKEGRSGA